MEYSKEGFHGISIKITFKLQKAWEAPLFPGRRATDPAQAHPGAGVSPSPQIWDSWVHCGAGPWVVGRAGQQRVSSGYGSHVGSLQLQRLRGGRV